MAAGAVRVAAASPRDGVGRDLCGQEVLHLRSAMWPFESCHYLSGKLELPDGQVVVVVVAEDTSAPQGLGPGPWLRDGWRNPRGPEGGIEVRT